jgi:putative transposase
MSRGDRRCDIFCDDIDRRHFLDTLAKEVEQQRWRLYAYCLMGNHYHVLVETPDANLAAGMRRLNGVYTQFFNRRHGLVGHVLQGRYKSVIVDRDAYLLELARYIVLNPVRAGLVSDAKDWPWSSYRGTAGMVAAPHWLSVQAITGQFGNQVLAAQQVYRDFVLDGVHIPSPWGELRGQTYLGGERFLRDIEGLLADGPDKQSVSRARRDLVRPSGESLLNGVADAFGVDAGSIVARRHQPAFRAWVYLLRRASNLSLHDAALRAGVSQGRVSQIQREMDALTSTPTLAALMERYKVWG